MQSRFIRHKNTGKTQKGNVLFIILLGVVLFAGLSFTVMRGQSNSSMDTGDFERAKIHASEILRYPATMRQAIERMRMNGTGENDFSFAHPDLHSDYGTFGTDPENEVFHPDGGMMEYMPPKTEWLDSSFSAESQYGTWRFSVHNSVNFIGESCTTDQRCVDLLIMLPFVSRDVCMAINALLGIDDYSTEPQEDEFSFGLNALFDGTYPSTSYSISTANSDYLALDSYCIKASGAAPPPANSYHFYQVLIAR